jgi:polyketide biosynthesis enoyl-CoA hydratase PksH
MQSSFDHLSLSKTPLVWTATLCRPDAGNSLNTAMLRALENCLTEAESDHESRLFVLRSEGVFCSGMDLTEAIHPRSVSDGGADFFRFLKRLAISPKLTVAIVGGRASGGGVGLAAAMDVVLATHEASFTLSEALFGLVPANILPFLVRRLGIQRSRYLALTTRTLSASEAQLAGLADEVTNDPDESLRRLLLRIARISEETVTANKLYIEKLWPITDEMEAAASKQLRTLLQKPSIQTGLRGFVEHGTLPTTQSQEAWP